MIEAVTEEVVMNTNRHTSNNRSRRLRHEAEHVHPVLAQAYRRRAAEIELVTWVRSVVTSTAPAEELALAG
jgi:hypothetical protein